MYQHILVPVDNSSSSKAVLAEVARFAQLCPGAVIRLIHVVDLAPVSLGISDYLRAEAVTEKEEQTKKAGQALLDEVCADAKKAGFEPETSLVETWGRAAPEAVVDAAKAWSADIIIMGTHGYSGLSHLLMGSVAEGVVRHAPVPVLLVRARS